MIYFAIPDGHQMKHVLTFFESIGFNFKGYGAPPFPRELELAITSEQTRRIFKDHDRVKAKVIRPQDMPMHVAARSDVSVNREARGFDLAITGTDWLREHKIRYPESPVQELVKLGFGRVKIVAAVHESLPLDSIQELRDYLRSFEPRNFFRIASEYIYIADDFAREHKLYKYRVIMTYGATESLIPEDAEMIIENTETGSTLRKNNLKKLQIPDNSTVSKDCIFESEGCLIANTESLKDKEKSKIISDIVRVFEDIRE